MVLRVLLTAATTVWLAVGFVLAEGNPPVRVNQSGEFLELEQQIDGRVVKNSLPLYRSGEVRYFSAGVGLEERSAEYPPFTLKMVFTAGGKPFLAGVDVTIQPVNGGAPITISRDQVEGPWLFVDLPAGTYDIAAAHGDRKQALKGIKVEAGKQKTLYLRWADDVGVAVKTPGD